MQDSALSEIKSISQKKWILNIFQCKKKMIEAVATRETRQVLSVTLNYVFVFTRFFDISFLVTSISYHFLFWRIKKQQQSKNKIKNETKTSLQKQHYDVKFKK